MFFFFSEVGGRPVAIYLLALTTLTTLMTSAMPTMPISLRLYYQHWHMRSLDGVIVRWILVRPYDLPTL
jgi:hypothetical protein